MLAVLEREGVEKFEKSWQELVDTIEGQLEKARRDRRRRDAGTRLEHRRGDPLDADGAHYELFFGYRDEAAFAAQVEQLVADRFASRLAAKDHTLWGPAAEDESAKRLGWVDLSRTSQPLVAEIAALRGELHGQGLTRVVLCGMGGSSLAPEVICAAAGVELDVLDSSDPDFVRTAIDNDLAAHRRRRLVEVRRHRRDRQPAPRLREGVRATPASTPRERIIVVTDPGSPLDQSATEAGYRVFRADPDVGGRFSALTAFGLVPSGLAGADIGAAAGRGRGDPRRPRAGLRRQPRPAPRAPCSGWPTWPASTSSCCATPRPAYAGFGDWAEQLIAESTGKDGKGVLPVIVESPTRPELLPEHPRRGARHASAPGWLFDDVRTKSGWGVSVDAPLGAQLLLWEYATAVAGADHRDQPVRPARRRERQGGCPRPARRRRRPAGAEVRRRPGHGLRLRAWLAEARRPCATRSSRCWPSWTPTTATSPCRPTSTVIADAALAAVRDALAAATGRPVTFGWGPRFLHSTGQYHKGGPSTGVYLQVTGQPEADLAVPGPAVHLPRVPDRPGGRRRPGARRARAARCCGCTSPARPTWTPYARLLAVTRSGDGHQRRRGPTRCATREDRRLPRIAGPCGMVLFGVTGDLSRKKVMPAIYDLANRGLLPPGFSLVGFARRDWANQDFAADRPRLGQASTPARSSARRSGRSLPRGSGSCRATSTTTSAFGNLRRTIEELDEVRGTGGNHAFYLAIPPGFFGDGGRPAQGARTWSTERPDAWRRVVVEKPFGHDLASAQELKATLVGGLPAGVDLPDRPLPRQGDRAEHPGDAVRQRDVRADLELQLRRPRADHHGRGHRHRRPGRLLRRHRRRPRRDPEPPAPADGAGRDGGADLVRRRRACASRSRRCCRASSSRAGST